MATQVKQTYTPSLNTSISTREGRIVSVTVWQTGTPGSTDRSVSK